MKIENKNIYSIFFFKKKLLLRFQLAFISFAFSIPFFFIYLLFIFLPRACIDHWLEIFSPGKPTLQYIQTTFLPMILRSVTGCATPQQSIIDALNTRVWLIQLG